MKGQNDDYDDLVRDRAMKLFGVAQFAASERRFITYEEAAASIDLSPTSAEFKDALTELSNICFYEEHCEDLCVVFVSTLAGSTYLQTSYGFWIDHAKWGLDMTKATEEQKTAALSGIIRKTHTFFINKLKKLDNSANYKTIEKIKKLANAEDLGVSADIGYGT